MSIEIKEVSKKYGKKAVLSNINQTFGNGVYGILGPNGAGKTTLLNIIATVIPASQGSILFQGHAVNARSDEYRAIIGYLPQKVEFYSHFTGYDFLKYMYILKGGKEKNPEQLAYLLKRLHLYNVKDDRIGTYSGGMRQRLGIAQAFIGEPQLLLLDEPTVGLDLEERAEFKRMIREAGKNSCVILTTHIVSDVEETADYVMFMQDGCIIEGNESSYYDGLMKREGVEGLEDYYLKLAGRTLYDTVD